MHILDHYKVPIKGLRTTILGRGHLVGYPLSSMLLDRKASVTILTENSKNVEAHIRHVKIIFFYYKFTFS